MIEITSQYLASQGLSKTFPKRFWKYVFIVPYDRGCWLWIGHTVRGYGEIGRGSATAGDIRANRASWILHFGPIPDGQFVCHKCDNPACVRPDHLFLGTQTDNMRDCARKGRTNPYDRTGERNPKVKLTWDQVTQIRKLHSDGIPEQQLAEMFGVVHGTIWFIVRNKTWTVVTRPQPTESKPSCTRRR